MRLYGCAAQGGTDLLDRCCLEARKLDLANSRSVPQLPSRSLHKTSVARLRLRGRRDAVLG